MTAVQEDDASALWHAALLHDGDDEFLHVALPYLREGLDGGDAVVVALTPRDGELVRRSLGRDAEHVTFVDMTHLGRNPARVLPELGVFRRSQAPGRRVRALGSPVWPGRNAAELLSCQEHDALLNVAFADAPISVLCPFDRARLDPGTLGWAATTHPVVHEHGRWIPSPRYGDPVAVAAGAAGPLPDPDDVGETLVYRAPHGPRQVRRAVAEHARRYGLGDDRVADLCLAVHEAAVNTVVHTSGVGLLTLWTDDDAVVCQIQDGGWIDDPLIGRHTPDPADGRGYGLFLAHRLCDLVRVHTDPVDGTSVRMWMRVEDAKTTPEP